MTEVKLPFDLPGTFPGVPLTGHLCSIRQGDRKLYWRVEHLIAASKELPVIEQEIEPLLSQIGNSTWFGGDKKPTISEILIHIERAFAANLDCPLILSAEGKIMDGSHRLIAAKMKGRKTLPCVRFLCNPPPEHEETIT